MGITTIQELVYQRLVGDATFLGMLADGANSIFPRAGAYPDGSTPPPYAVVKYGSRAYSSTTEFTSFQLYLYDDPRQEYWRLYEIAERLRSLFHWQSLGPSEPGYTQYGRVQHELTSSPLTDGGWDKNLVFCRFTVTGL